tara:strand:+ start:976 stop:1563 length:588 start_codon:yes stop_codon:yes gene_type:complete
MKNFIGIYDNALSKKDCRDIIEQCERGSFNKGKAAPYVDETRDFLTNSYPRLSDTSNHLTHTLYALRQSLLKYTAKYVDSNKELTTCVGKWHECDAFNIQKYNPKQFYQILHCEMDGLEQRDNQLVYDRMLVWMFYLNTVRDGGGTAFPQYNKIIKAREGRLVIWPAYWTHMHKGIVSNTETKYIATGWYVFKTS